MDMEQHIFTVSEVNGLTKHLLENEPMLQRIFVQGELSNYKMHPTGHHFFTMKDAGGALRCVMYRREASRLRFRPENGMKVIAQGRIGVYLRDGAYQLYCDTLTPEGAGDLAIAFEQLKARLYAEGLFDEAHKKPLPPFPEKIAVITAASGAAVHDMISILRRRYPIAKVIILSVRVQGAEAPPEIVGAIRYADKWKIGDVIIVGRGGGSVEDLWAFNDERVARAIYHCQTPIISAVGHEPDVTISDFVADRRALTPSNAAEIVVKDQVELLRSLKNSAARIAQSETDRLEFLRHRLNTLAEKRVMRDHLAYIEDKRMMVSHLQQRIGDLGANTVSRRREKFAALSASLDAMSPLKVLGRGYAMAQSMDGGILKSWQDVSPGDRAAVTLGEGGFTCTVDEVIKKNKRKS